MSTPTTLPSDAHGPDTRPSSPTLDTYMHATLAAYDLTNEQGKANGDFKAPKGLSLIARSDPSLVKDGFSAAAFKDKSGNVIIAFEGTVANLSEGNVYGPATIRADQEIADGKTPKALDDAIAFAELVQKQTGQKVYVTGHSLGGIEAEAVAKALGDQLAGGMTFGASGLPGNDKEGPKTFINYVDYGDAVANRSSDPDSPSKSEVTGNMRHYGTVVMTGSADGAAALKDAAEEHRAEAQARGHGAFGDLMSGLRSAKTNASELSTLPGHHLVKNYEADLHIEIEPATRPTTLPATQPATTRVSYIGDSGSSAVSADAGISLKNAGAVHTDHSGRSPSPGSAFDPMLALANMDQQKGRA